MVLEDWQSRVRLVTLLLVVRAVLSRPGALLDHALTLTIGSQRSGQGDKGSPKGRVTIAPEFESGNAILDVSQQVPEGNPAQ